MNYRENKNTGRSIATVQDVAKYVNITLTGSDETDPIYSFINDCINRVSATFENYCNKGLKINDYTGYYDGNESPKLYTAQYPIIEIKTLQYGSEKNGWVDFFPSDLVNQYYGTGTQPEFIPNLKSGYNLYVYNYFIELIDKSFPVGKQNIKIIYTSGYADCPADLKRVCIEEVAQMLEESGFKGIGKSNLGLKTKSNANEQYSFDDISIKTKMVLDNYRKIII